jgi:multiple sugar transport system permease protein
MSTIVLGDRRRRRLGGFHGSIKYLFMAPTVTVLVLVVAAPLAYSLYLSFHEYLVVYGLGNFVGFENYIVVFKGGLVSVSWVTLVFTFWAVLVEFVIAFGLALLLNQPNLGGRDIYLAILMIPILMTPVAVALMFRLMFNPDLGIVNYLIGLIGIAPQGWFGDSSLALPVVIFVDIWHETSLLLLILYAGLQSLPRDPEEAAYIDGASTMSVLWHVTVPLMKPVILVTLLIRMIGALKTYDLIYMLTFGGPGTATETVSFHAYRLGFRMLDIGQSAAVSFILLLAVLALTLLLIRALRES